MALDPKTTRRALLTAAFLLLAAAAALISLGTGVSRLLAMLAVFASAIVSRRAKELGAMVPGARAIGGSAPKPVRWLVGVLLLISVGAAYWFLSYSERRGYTNAFPVYLFGATLVASLWWLTSLLSRWV